MALVLSSEFKKDFKKLPEGVTWNKLLFLDLLDTPGELAQVTVPD